MKSRATKPAGRGAKPAPKPAPKPRAAAPAPTAPETPPAPLPELEAPQERPWRDMTADAPFCERTERRQAHGEVELLLDGAVVVARWGAYITASSGKAFGWINRAGRHVGGFYDPTGWREVQRKA